MKWQEVNFKETEKESKKRKKREVWRTLSLQEYEEERGEFWRNRKGEV